MKFADVVRGTRQDEDLELPRYDGQPEDSPALHCRVRALNGLEEEQVLANAAKRAKALGVEAPRAGDPIYDLALMCETILVACLDPESPSDARRPFFDSVEQVRAHFGREAIAFIYELQQTYQDRVAPTVHKLGPVEYVAGLSILGGEDEGAALRFFTSCSVGMRWSYMRSTAVQLLSSPEPSSTSGGTSGSSGTSESERQ